MGKQAKATVRQANQAIAVARHLKGSPQKLGLVAGLIRGKHVSDAMSILTFSKKTLAKDALKTLMSAVANAENNNSLDVDSLYVKEAYVGKTITMRRFHARGRGRSSRIQKPFSQLTIIVEEAAGEA